ncbi:hypothetical protein [Amycolatopsis sp. CA-230715]|uniref:hypothetical protein n=1 Tax=Amycolatopsis sp. CA-230715 TaxID=2745196 RepID=UPI001C0293A7|nr:hypothetical protein [Amycolatopsis sp. CA-230715]QWF85531.1 hypothetical protein HUW46_08986 [Amycolatopsis sp. CA-230715]
MSTHASPRRLLGIAALACALPLAACSGQDTPSAPAPDNAAQTGGTPPGPASDPAAHPAAPGTECGPVPSVNGAKAKVVVTAGAVDCAQATTLLTQYFQKLTPADLANPDGAGPVALGEWTCGSGPASAPATTCSTEDNRQVDGV